MSSGALHHMQYITKEKQKKRTILKKIGLLKLLFVWINFESLQTCQAKCLSFQLATDEN